MRLKRRGERGRNKIMSIEYPGIKCSHCGYERDGAHYNLWNISKGGIKGLQTMFPEGEADGMNFVLFSTSGVHGTYSTIEDIEESPGKYGTNPEFIRDNGDDIPEDYCYPDLTVTVYHPRIIGVGWGNVKVTLEDIPFLKKLRASSWQVVQEIGKAR
jgi:hypothetical protein